MRQNIWRDVFVDIFFGQFNKVGQISAAKKTEIIDRISKLFLGLCNEGKMKNISIFLTDVGKFHLSRVISFSNDAIFDQKKNFDRL